MTDIQAPHVLNPAAYCLLAGALATSALPVAAQTTTPSEIRFSVRHFHLDGTAPLSAKALEAYFQPRQQKQYSLKELQLVAQGLETLIRDDGHPFYRVVLPPQTLSGGDVTFKVVSFALENIEVTGNQYFDHDNILSSLPNLKKGASPSTEQLSSQLKVANKHPAKQVQLTFKQSQTADKIDAKVNVTEERPLQAALLFNTVGTAKTGNIRMTGVLQHSNVWGLDHIVNGSYTTSPDHSDSVNQYGVSYSLPVYALKGWFSSYYAYSDVSNGTIGAFTVTGSGEMYGFHYQQLLPKLGRIEHWLDVGIDNRFFINDIQFLNQPIGTNVRSVPVSVQYKGELPWQTAQLTYHAEWLGNTGLDDNNTLADYLASRAGANQDWNIVRYGTQLSVNINRWLVQTTFTAQYSSDALIAGEQLGVGGSYDVRGYQERETSADSGEIIKFEVTTPSWQQFNLFAFYDYGHGYSNNSLPGSLKDWNLSSAGIGAAWQWQNHVQAKIAVANALEDAVTTQAGDARIHASIALRY